MSTIFDKFEMLKKDFERYLISDREEYFRKRYEAETHSLNMAYLQNEFAGIQNKLTKKGKDLNKIIELMRENNIQSIFRCFYADKKEKKAADKSCLNFLEIFVTTLEEVLKCLTYENIFHTRNYSPEQNELIEYNQFKKQSQIVIKNIIEVLSKCLIFSNKNTPNTRSAFKKLYKNQKETFLLISNIRIVAYIMRSYFYFSLTKMLPHYLKDENQLIRSLNDSNKVLAILERDFNFCEITKGRVQKRINDYIKQNKWHAYSYIVSNIIKGNVFYELKNYSKSLDAFCDAVRFYDRINNGSEPESKSPDMAICKLLIGKILGEKGLLLDSLIWFLEAITSFSELGERSVSVKEMLVDHIEVFHYEKTKDILNKKMIYKFLNDVDPQIFIDNKDKHWIRGYKSDLICRIGYALYILLWKRRGKKNNKKIAKWFNISLKLNKYNSLALQNLNLAYSSTVKPKQLRTILSSEKIENSRKINFWAMYELKRQEEIRNTINTRNLIKHGILSSLLTSLDNIITTPQLFNRKITLKRKIEKENINKLLILRRWNSYTPIIPRPIDFTRHSGGTYSHGINRFPGGGYFLIWNNKGIVIDPGFDFLRNLYSTGYSIADIDAIVVTHSHVDHMNDFFSLLTLIYERNNILKIQGVKKTRKIDLFLNLGALNSFLAWSSAQTKETVNHIFSLPRSSSINELNNCSIDLTQTEYKMKLEIVPANHDEILSDKWAVGLKFYLPINNTVPDFVIGITGDTSFYKKLLDSYIESDILIAHLGDIDFKELIEFSEINLEPDLFLNHIKKTKNPEEISQLKELSISLGVKSEQLKDLKSIKKLYELILSPQTIAGPQNHLGFKGIDSLARHFAKNNTSPSKMFVLSEFPEYLGSFRKRITYLLNKYFNQKTCFVGDINLQIKIDCKDNKKICKVLCNKCARDNDIPHAEAFHHLSHIQEICVKASDECMVYHCKEHEIEAADQFYNKVTF